jgi:hypothetical protein
VPVYDQGTHTPPGDLIREHQSGRAGSDHQDVCIHVISTHARKNEKLCHETLPRNEKDAMPPDMLKQPARQADSHYFNIE